MPVVWIRDGRAFMRIDDGWLDLGPDNKVRRMTPLQVVELAKEMIKMPRWHKVPRRPM